MKMFVNEKGKFGYFTGSRKLTKQEDEMAFHKWEAENFMIVRWEIPLRYLWLELEFKRWNRGAKVWLNITMH